VSGQKWIVNSDHTRDVFLAHAAKLYDEHKYVEFSFKVGQQRTSQQNRALHKYCEQLSSAFNDAGLDVHHTLSQDIEIPWNPLLVKELIWKKVQIPLLNITSTTKLDRKQCSDVYEVINRYTATTFCISLPFPCKNDN